MSSLGKASASPRGVGSPAAGGRPTAAPATSEPGQRSGTAKEGVEAVEGSSGLDGKTKSSSGLNAPGKTGGKSPERSRTVSIGGGGDMRLQILTIEVKELHNVDVSGKVRRVVLGLGDKWRFEPGKIQDKSKTSRWDVDVGTDVVSRVDVSDAELSSVELRCEMFYMKGLRVREESLGEGTVSLAMLVDASNHNADKDFIVQLKNKKDEEIGNAEIRCRLVVGPDAGVGVASGETSPKSSKGKAVPSRGSLSPRGRRANSAGSPPKQRSGVDSEDPSGPSESVATDMDGDMDGGKPVLVDSDPPSKAGRTRPVLSSGNTKAAENRRSESKGQSADTVGDVDMAAGNEITCEPTDPRSGIGQCLFRPP